MCLTSSQDYDIPVCGDWFMIAVITEHSLIKCSEAPMTIDTDDDEGGKQKEKSFKPSGEKYIIMLVDFLS